MVKMKTLAVLCVGMVLAPRVYAVNDLGPIDIARSQHPAVFVPCNVLEYTVGGEQGYVFGGEAAQCFGTALPDSRLYRAAMLDARRNLYKFLTKNDKSKSVEMSGARPLYQYAEKEMRRVVLFVQKDKVRVFDVPTPVPVKKPAPVAETVVQSGVVQSDKISADAGISPAETNTTSSLLSSVVIETPSTSSDSVAVPINTAAVVQASCEMVSEASEAPAAQVDQLAVYLRRMEASPNDCTILSEVARLYAERDNIPQASSIYAKLVQCVRNDAKMDKVSAVQFLMEAAEFEKEYGDAQRALDYYRIFVRCDGERGWKLPEQVSEAQKNISQLLLKTF